jgi:hypothetical protein
MPISAPELQVTKYVGDAPAAGIVYALMPDNSARAVLGYDPATSTALLPAKTSATVSLDAAVQVLTAANASAGANAQAIVAVTTSSVTGYVVAMNGTTTPGVHLVAQTNHALYFATNAAIRAKLLPTGEFIIGASDVGGSELLRVALGIRAGGKLLSGTATSLAEVAAAQVGARLTFSGDSTGWQLRFARQAGYGAAPVDVLALSDTGTLLPVTDATGALGTQTVRWGAAFVSVARLGAAVAGVRPEALIVGGDSYFSGYAAVFATNANAFQVVNPANGHQPFRVDSVGDAVYATPKFYVGTTAATALFAADGLIPSVRVGNGSPQGSIPFYVNGTISGWNQIKLNDVLLFDRNAVAGWTRLYAADARIALSFSDGPNGNQFVVPTALFSVWDAAVATTLFSIDGSTTPTQLGMIVNHNGVQKRVQVGGTDSGGAGRRLLTIVN